MAMKQPGRKTYRSANGKNIDLDLLISRNELTPAVSNVKVNARGDELGPGGKIVRKKEDVLNDYYKQTSGVANESVAKTVKEQAKEEPVEEVKKTTSKKASAAELDKWIEDDEGNFVENTSNKPTNKKGD